MPKLATTSKYYAKVKLLKAWFPTSGLFKLLIGIISPLCGNSSKVKATNLLLLTVSISDELSNSDGSILLESWLSEDPLITFQRLPKSEERYEMWLFGLDF